MVIMWYYAEMNASYFQMFGFMLYVTEYAAKDNGGGVVSIPKVQLSLTI